MIRLLIHFGLAIPAVILTFGWRFNRLGVDPEKTLIWETGIWALNFLVVTLLIPVAARWAHWSDLRKYRRAIGLWAFSYASAHFGFFVIFLLGWDVIRLGKELSERPYILFGFGAWIILASMAVTSNQFAIKLLRKKWAVLHKWIYVAVFLAVIHYILMIRSNFAWPATYTIIAIVLIILRWKRSRAKKKLKVN